MSADKDTRSQAQLCAKAMLTSSFLQEVVSTTVNELLSNEEVLSAVTSAFNKLQEPPMALLPAAAEPGTEDVTKEAEGKTNEEPHEEPHEVPQGEPQKAPEEKSFVSTIITRSEPDLIPEVDPVEVMCDAEDVGYQPPEALASVTSETQKPECHLNCKAREAEPQPEELPVKPTHKAEECEYLSLMNLAWGTAEPKLKPKPKRNQQHVQKCIKGTRPPGGKGHKKTIVSQKKGFEDETHGTLTSTFRLPKPDKSKRILGCFRELLASSQDLGSIIRGGRKLLQKEIARMSEGLAVLRSKYEKEFLKPVGGVKAECLLCPEAIRTENYKWAFLDSHYQQHIYFKYFVCNFCSSGYKLPFELWQHFKGCRRFELFLAARIQDRPLLMSIRKKILACHDDLRFLKRMNNPGLIIAEYSN